MRASPSIIGNTYKILHIFSGPVQIKWPSWADINILADISRVGAD